MINEYVGISDDKTFVLFTNNKVEFPLQGRKRWGWGSHSTDAVRIETAIRILTREVPMGLIGPHAMTFAQDALKVFPARWRLTSDAIHQWMDTGKLDDLLMSLEMRIP